MHKGVTWKKVTPRTNKGVSCKVERTLQYYYYVKLATLVSYLSYLFFDGVRIYFFMINDRKSN